MAVTASIGPVTQQDVAAPRQEDETYFIIRACNIPVAQVAPAVKTVHLEGWAA